MLRKRIRRGQAAAVVSVSHNLSAAVDPGGVTRRAAGEGVPRPVTLYRTPPPAFPTTAKRTTTAAICRFIFHRLSSRWCQSGSNQTVSYRSSEPYRVDCRQV